MDQPDEKDTKPKKRNPLWRLGRRIKQKRDQAKEVAESEGEPEKDEKSPAATSSAD
jgi:hypothetical protein